MMIEFTLPYPPAVNHYYRLVGGRGLLSKPARAYRGEVGAALFQQGMYDRSEGRLGIGIRAHPPDRRKRDLDGIFKGPLDAMEHAGVYVNDNQIKELHARMGQPGCPGRLLVRIWPLDELPAHHPVRALHDALDGIRAADKVMGRRTSPPEARISATKQFLSYLAIAADAIQTMTGQLGLDKYVPLADP